MLVRLQKLIAQAGVTSRRKAEALIVSGRVTVNGRIVTKLGTKADPLTSHIKVDGKLLHFRQPPLYLLLHKPKGFITSVSDPQGRPTVMELIRGVKGRLYPVGRLDYGTEGLLLLTNDGELAHALMHPRFEVMKRYHVKVKGVIPDEKITQLSRGIRLAPSTRPAARGRGLAQDSAGLYDGTTAPCTVRKLGKGEKNSWLEVGLHEGRYRQVRRMIEALGHDVLRLRRVGYGPLALGDLSPGQSRRLTPREVDALRRATGSARVRKPLVQAGGESRFLPRSPIGFTK